LVVPTTIWTTSVVGVIFKNGNGIKARTWAGAQKTLNATFYYIAILSIHVKLNIGTILVNGEGKMVIKSNWKFYRGRVLDLGAQGADKNA